MRARGIFQWNDQYPSVAAFREDLRRNELYVLEDDSSIVGCITISTKKDLEYEEIVWLTAEGIHNYIHRLAVHPAHQGSGNARSLMDFAEKLATHNGARSVRLDTFSRNERNQRFYRNRGYRQLDAIYFPNQSPYPFYCFEKVLHYNES